MFVGLIPSLHRVLPSILICTAVFHASRAILRQYGTGSKAIGSGIAVLFTLVAVFSTGYMASCGEAGFWGGVISFSPAISVASIVFSDLFGQLLTLLAFYGVKYNVAVSVLGSTSINTAIFEIALSIHVLFGTLIFIHILSHSGAIHGGSSVFGYSSKEVFKLSILSSIESRDLRFGTFCITWFLLTNTDLMWLLRLGNVQNLSTEIKAPNKVMTELYLSSIYDCLRQYPIVVISFIFVILFVLAFGVTGIRVSKYCAVLVFFTILVSILDRSFAGFVAVDFDSVRIVESTKINEHNYAPQYSEDIYSLAEKITCL
jgi:hypothetical protein